MNGAQQQKIATWAEQRDGLIREIGILETEKAIGIKTNKELGLSNIDLEKQIAEKKGILSQLKETEDRFRDSVSKDVSDLIAQKSSLESEVDALNVEISFLNNKKSEIKENIALLIELHDKALDRVEAIDHVVERARTLSHEQFARMQDFLNKLRIMVDDTTKIHTETMKVGSLALEKFPRFIFEMQRVIPVRRPMDRIPKRVNIKSNIGE